MAAAHDELVIVAQRSVRQVVKVDYLEHAPVRRHAHARTPNVARLLSRPTSQKQQPSAYDEVDGRPS
jgi:hypothetical protein